EGNESWVGLHPIPNHCGCYELRWRPPLRGYIRPRLPDQTSVSTVGHQVAVVLDAHPCNVIGRAAARPMHGSIRPEDHAIPIGLLDSPCDLFVVRVAGPDG